MKNSKSPLVVFCAISLLAGVTSLSAASKETGTLTVTATISTTCTVNNVSIDLGTITTNVVNNTTGSLIVSCTTGLPYAIDLNPGLNNFQGYQARSMASGTNRLVYNIYQDSAHTQVWGIQMGGGEKSGLVGTGVFQSIPFYVQVPAQTAPPSGTYSDTITITATF